MKILVDAVAVLLVVVLMFPKVGITEGVVMTIPVVVKLAIGVVVPSFPFLSCDKVDFI
jgi:hypothetical protein